MMIVLDALKELVKPHDFSGHSNYKESQRLYLTEGVCIYVLEETFRLCDIGLTPRNQLLVSIVESSMHEKQQVSL